LTQQFVIPQLATLVEVPPVGDGWAFEMKYDGYRLEALLDGGVVRLLTRRGNDWTQRFPELAKRLARLPVKRAILDGEVVALDASGRSHFNLLQQSLDASRSDDLVYFVFDLLSVDGEDLRSYPLSGRRERLERLLRKARALDNGLVRLGQRLEGPGTALLRAACQHGLEGIMGKRLDAGYSSGRGPGWVKVKCGRRQEFVVVGYTPPKGSRVGIGSLLLAVQEKGKLRYAGRVGSGFADDSLRTLLRRLQPLERKATPLGSRPAGIPGVTQWVAPRIVVEVTFTEWTPDGLLRHPVFVGVREDKRAKDVHREEAAVSQPRATKGASRVASKRAPRAASSTEEATIAGVRITHPDRVVYPEAGLTKLDLARHFERIGALILPHVIARPLSLVRCPEGSAGECFFQKHWPGTPPPAIDGVPIRQSDGVRRHVVIHDLEGLITLIQWGVMEIHPWGSRADDPERPDRIIFDLDPGPGVTWADVKEATSGIRALLEALDLETWLKTSGGKGLHVVLPIARRSSWDEVSGFARAVAEHMQAEFPDRFISKASKVARKGLIFVDWLRNTRGATAVAPWCTRARPNAGVSVPIPWSQLPALRSGDQFTLESIRAKPPKTDPWKNLAAVRQSLSRTMLRRLKVAV
jgi:bifunctional non-homologous end joining protein LigD